MTDKITNRDISTGVKVGYIIITTFFSGTIVLLSWTFTGGQVVERVDSMEEAVKDTVKQKEQTSVDIAVMKNEIKNLNREFDSFKRQYTDDIKDLKQLIKERP